MKHSTKVYVSKYLLAAASLLPVAHSANAKSNFVLQRSASAVSCDPLDLTLRAGLVYVLPNPSTESLRTNKEMTGFNGGAYLEFGGAYWGKFGYSDVELHVEPVGRIECLTYNTCIYGINADYAAANAVGKTGLPQPVEMYPYERVEDFIGTANMNVGLGYRGFTVGVVGGLGMHVDTKHQTDMVMCLGAGFDARLNNHIKLHAGYRARVNFFGNGTVKTSNAGAFHHSVELSFAYMFFKRNRGHNTYAYNSRNFRHR